MAFNVPVPPSAKALKPVAPDFAARAAKVATTMTEMTPTDESPRAGNGDEQDYQDKSASYFKGLRQPAPGRAEIEEFSKFRKVLSASFSCIRFPFCGCLCCRCRLGTPD